MKLHTVKVTHYAPKGDHSAIERYLLAKNEEEIITWLNTTHLTQWDDEEWAEEENTISPAAEWWDDHPEAAERARGMGLAVVGDAGDCGAVLNTWYEEDASLYVEGPQSILLRWWRGDDFEELSNLYYGAVHFSWDAGCEVTDAEVEVLLRLGVAERA